MEQEQKPTAKFIGPLCFSREKNEFVRLVAPITKIFDEVVLDYNEIPWTLDGLFPRDTCIDLNNERVCLIMSDYCIKGADICGQFIEARKTENGFKIGDIEVREEEIKPTIEQQVKELIGNK